MYFCILSALVANNRVTMNKRVLMGIIRNKQVENNFTFWGRTTHYFLSYSYPVS